MNSIMMPAVIENQMAANTGAVVRNFFMGRIATWVRGEELVRIFSGAKR